MPTHKLVVEIDDEGKVKMLFSGFKGNACFYAASDIFAALKNLGVDVDVEKVVRTPESYEEEKQADIVKEPNS